MAGVAGAVTATAKLARDGRFNAPTTTRTEPVGSARVTFESCTRGRIVFNLLDPPATGTIPLTRLLAPGTLCQAAR